MSDSPWSALAECWEELFPLRPARLAMALELAPPGTRTLDAGCATGSLPRALAARGRPAHGLDLEPAFLAVARVKAREAAVAVAWHEAGLLDLAAAAGPARFQLITCLGQTLPHLQDEAEWTAFFTQARTLLAPGGHLVIQVVNDGGLPAGHVRELPALELPAARLERRRIMASETHARFETAFHAGPGEPLCRAVSHLRMTPERAADLLRAAGLAPGEALADESGRPFVASSPGWLLMARRT